MDDNATSDECTTLAVGLSQTKVHLHGYAEVSRKDLLVGFTWLSTAAPGDSVRARDIAEELVEASFGDTGRSGSYAQFVTNPDPRVGQVRDRAIWPTRTPHPRL